MAPLCLHAFFVNLVGSNKQEGAKIAKHLSEIFIPTCRHGITTWRGPAEPRAEVDEWKGIAFRTAMTAVARARNGTLRIGTEQA